MKAHLKTNKNNFNTVLNISGSKSISNRLLIFQALSGSHKLIENISTSNDTVVLHDAIKSNDVNIDVGDAGTAFRFLTCLLYTSPSPRD